MTTKWHILGMVALLGAAAAWGRNAPVPLGVVFRGEVARASLEFVHAVGSEALTLAGAETSCDCLSAQFSPVRVEPGQVVHLPFTYSSKATGRAEMTVTFLAPDRKSAGVVTVTVFVADREWLISPAVLQSRDVSEPITLIDVRSAAQFGAAHIPQAINVPAFAIKTRADLRERRVVLIDDGVAPDELLEDVRSLRLRGFKGVVVLEGGMPGWMRAGLPAEGTSVSTMSIAAVSPAAFVRARASAPWRVLEIGSRGGDSGPGQFERWEDAAARLPRREADPARLAANVLVIAPDATAHANIEARLQGPTAPPVFYLEGGQAALGEFLRAQALMAQGARLERQAPLQATRRGVTHGCNTCPK